MSEEYEIEVWQDDMPVASASGPDRDAVVREALHYATVYGQDGPVQLFEVIRRPLPLPGASS